MDVDAVSEVVIALARKFEAYSCGDLDVAKAKELAVKKTLEAELGA
jgi:hypothetical protein